MDKGMTQFASKGLGAALPFRKEERKELAPQKSTADSICKSNPLKSHPALACFFNLTYFPHMGNICSSSLCEIFQHNSSFFKKIGCGVAADSPKPQIQPGAGQRQWSMGEQPHADSKKGNPLCGLTQTHISMDLREKQVEA